MCTFPDGFLWGVASATYRGAYPQLLWDRFAERGCAPKAIYVTENGASYVDPAPADGVVDDPGRLAYLRAHFKSSNALPDAA